jgi:hypothetical protein
VIAAGLVAAGSLLALRKAGHPRSVGIGLFIRECGIVMALYGLWMYLGEHTGGTAHGAYARAADLLSAEKAVHLDVERGLQQMVIHDHGVIQFANVFYATAHFGAMGIFLVWAFLRHRDRYGGVRTRVVLVTLISLFIQFMPLAPPRLLAESQLVDTPQLYGQSVYSAGFAQVAAMPSVHLAWAVLVAWEVWRISAFRLRGWIVLHPLVTMWAVMVTGNHWLFDGLAGGAIVAVVEALCYVVARWHRPRRTAVPADVDVQEPEYV